MTETVGIFFSDPAMAAFLVFLSSIPHDEGSAKKWKKKWYFVTKIVLTYSEKNCSSDEEKV